MNARVRTSLRLLAALAVAVTLLAAGGWASAAGRPAQVPLARSVDSSAVPATWCCPDGAGQGITVTGQASVHGRGATARDDAIASAVADATDQAKAAASAAGVTLGKIVDMQVSTSPFAVPVYAGGSSSGAGVAPPSDPVGSTTCIGIACPNNAECACPAMPVQQSASVTITWAIG